VLEHTAACAHCGEQFTRTRLRGRPPMYCGSACRRRASDAKVKADGRYAARLASERAKHTPIKRTIACAECDSTFEGNGRAKYCGVECRRTVRLRETREWVARTDYHAMHRAKPEVKVKRQAYEKANGRAYRQAAKISAACVICGAEWMADCRAKSRPVKYCSRTCKAVGLHGGPRTRVPVGHPIRSTPVPDLHPSRRAKCPRCVRTYSIQWRGQVYCSQACADRASSARRDARKRGQRVGQVSPAAVYARDFWICQLCGDPLDMDAVVPDWYAPTVDHIIPLAHGGEHSMANTQAAHFICNSRKGDRVGAKDLAS